MNERYYINVKEVMMKLLPKPKKKPDIPIISVECELWSYVTW